MDSPELVKFSPISPEGFHVTTVLLVLGSTHWKQISQLPLSQRSVGINLSRNEAASWQRVPFGPCWGHLLASWGQGTRPKGSFSIAESHLGETGGFQGSVGS